MKREELTEIGRILRAKGLHGELKVLIDPFYETSLPTLNVLVIQKGDDFLPFFIENLRQQANPPLLKFESIHSKEEAATLNGKSIYAITSQLPEVKVDHSHSIEGFKLFNQSDEFIGEIIEVLEYPSQSLLRVHAEETEHLIPLHEDLIIDLNSIDQKLTMDIPDGLLNL